MKQSRESNESVENTPPVGSTENTSDDYHVNMIEAEQPALKRRRKNYRDPENAARLSMAMDILMKQRKEGKVQDLKQIAAHFGLESEIIT